MSALRGGTAERVGDIVQTINGESGDITLTSSGGTVTITTPTSTTINLEAAPSSVPGGSSGQIQYNNAGAFGGFTTSGDATINTGTGALTLSTVNASAGSFGTASNVASFTVNAKGLITAASNTPIAFPSLTLNNVITNGSSTSQQWQSTVSTGTAPFTVASTTLVSNLNADLLDGKNTGTSGNTIPLLDGTNTWSANQTHSDNIGGIYGTTNQGKVYYDGTNLIIDPSLSGSGYVSVGAGTGTKNFAANVMALGGSAVDGARLIQVDLTSGTYRAAMNFTMNFTGSFNAFGSLVMTTTDTGSNTGTFTYNNVTSSQQVATNNHNAINMAGAQVSLGYANSVDFTTAGNKNAYGFRVLLSSNGRGGTGTNAGNFVRVGFMQDTVTAIGGAPASDLILGAHFNNQIQIVPNAAIILDGNTGVPTNAGLGDTTIKYVSASTRVEMDVDGTDYLYASPTEVAINDTSVDMDFRVEGNGDANLLFTDAGNDKVGIGTNAPNSKLDVVGGFQCDSITNDTGLAAGAYTPTLTNVANLTSTAYQCQYMRVGNVVTVSGKADVDPTLAATLTQLGISLPIASNLGAAEDCAGTAFASGIAGQGAAIRGDAANDRAEMVWISGDITNQPMYFTFTYEVI